MKIWGIITNNIDTGASTIGISTTIPECTQITGTGGTELHIIQI